MSLKTLYPLSRKPNLPFYQTGEDSATGGQVGEGELGHPTSEGTNLNQPRQKGRIPAHVTTLTGETAQGAIAHIHTSVPIVVETTHMQGAKRNNFVNINKVKSHSQTSVSIVEGNTHMPDIKRNNLVKINKVRSQVQSQQQQKHGVAASKDLKRAHTAGDTGINKVARLCAHSQQHHEVQVAACKGERAERATPKSGKVKVARLCAQAPQQHEACVAAVSVECAGRAQHKSTHAQPGVTQTHTLANSPINIKHLNIELDEYTQINKEIAEELREGFTEGFRLGYLGPRVLQKSKNLVSVAENVEEVERKIMGEVNTGRVEGPFENVPFSNLRCSPIGLVPKKVPWEFRLIHHLSWPEGNSVYHILTQ